MKRLVSKLKPLPIARKAALVLSGILMFQTASNAQSIISCSTADNAYWTLSNRIYTLNADMVETSIGSNLMVAAWDLYPPNPGVMIGVTDKSTSFNYTTSVFISTKGESEPDVVWAVDPNNTNAYFVGVVFLNPSSLITFNTYKVTGMGTSSLTMVLNSSKVITSVAGTFPHIDMLPDYDNLVNGLPSLHRFAISYGLNTSSSTVDIREVHGDISNPTVFSAPTTVTTGGAYTFGADIAASYDPATKKEHLYLAYSDGSNLKQTDLQMNYLAGPLAPVASSTTNTLLSGSSILPLVRIEAMGYNPIVTGTTVPWVISTMQSGSVWAYNAFGVSYNCSIGISPTDYNQCPAITAGPGQPSGNVCNDNYNIGWHNSTNGYLTQTIDAGTGAISTTYPDYYVANNSPIVLPGGFSKIPVALTSCSNSGNYLFTGFWDGNTKILYHLKAGVSGYKQSHTTGIGNVAANNTIKVYPNPASGKMNIQGLKTGSYSIINILGQTVKSGIITNDNFELNIASLLNGNYYLSVQGDAVNNRIAFVKQ